MRQLLSIILLFFCLGLFAQSPAPVHKVATATTAFGVNIPIGSIIYNIATDKIYICKTATVSTATLTTGSANFTELVTGADRVLKTDSTANKGYFSWHRGDSIVQALKDTSSLSTILEDYVLYTDTATMFVKYPRAHNSTLTGLTHLSTLTVSGLTNDASADSVLTIAAGSVTRTAISALPGGGGGVTAAHVDSLTDIVRLAFTVDSTASAPVTGDSVVTHSGLIGKDISVYKGSGGGMERIIILPYFVYDLNSCEFDSESGTVTFHGPLRDGDRILIEGRDARTVTELAFEAPEEPELIMSYGTDNYASIESVCSTQNKRMGVAIQLSAAATLTSVKFYLAKSGSPTGSAYAKLYSIGTGTYGTDAKPTSGTAIATSDALDVSTLVDWTGKQLYEVTFSGANQYSLQANTAYGIALEYEGGDDSNRVFICNGTASFDGNVIFSFGGDTWYSDAGSNGAVIFYLFGK